MIEMMLIRSKVQRIAGIWTQFATMPATGREAHVGGEMGGKLYICGGRTGINPNVYRKDLWCYDPETNTWVAKADMSALRGQAASGVIDGKFYVYGGMNSVALRSLICYDPVTNAWTSKPDGPSARSGCSGAVVGTKLYIFGGNATANFKELHCYDTVTSEWSQLTSSPTGSFSSRMSAIGTKLYACIGNALLGYDTLTDTWMDLGTCPGIFSTEGTTVVDGKLYILYRAPDQYMYIYNPVTASWTFTNGKSPIGRSYGTLTTIGADIWIMGGYDQDTAKRLADLWRYIP